MWLSILVDTFGLRLAPERGARYFCRGGHGSPPSVTARLRSGVAG